MTFLVETLNYDIKKLGSSNLIRMPNRFETGRFQKKIYIRHPPVFRSSRIDLKKVLKKTKLLEFYSNFRTPRVHQKRSK